MACALPARLYSAARPNPDISETETFDTTTPDEATAGPDARSEDRLPVSTGAMLVEHQTDPQPVTIADLSRHGCCLEGNCAALRPGQFISIKIGRIGQLAVIVRWVDETRAGVEFTRALQPQVFEYYMRELSTD